jgi:hypothetical protein
MKNGEMKKKKKFRIEGKRTRQPSRSDTCIPQRRSSTVCRSAIFVAWLAVMTQQYVSGHFQTQATIQFNFVFLFKFFFFGSQEEIGF